MRRDRRTHVVVAAAFCAVVLVVAGAFIGSSDVRFKAYATPLIDGWVTRPLLSVGDEVPETSTRTPRYRLVGVLDGLGAERKGRRVIVYANHELAQSVQSQPIVGGPVSRGAFVSKLTLDAVSARVLSGERAYDRVYVADTLIGPAAEAGNTTPAFSRFCSGSLGTIRHGFTQSIYFTGEESSGAETFSGKGGQAVAIYGNGAHVIPKLGRLRFENVVPQPRSDAKTVLVALEDGPSTEPYSHLYLYVGTKRARGSVFARNGLGNGRLYVFTARGRSTEGDFSRGTVRGAWVEIPGSEAKTDAELAAAAVARGAFGFSRVEDGAFDPSRAGRFYFVTTGDNATFNRLGRIYQLDLAVDPAGPARLRLVVDADSVIRSGGDTAISPDNVATSDGYLLVQEDGTASSRPVLARRKRDGSIWRFPIDPRGLVATPERIVELDPPGRDGLDVGPGIWETSGIVDTASLFGAGTWLFDVQAGSPSRPPDAQSQVADGQLLLLRAPA